jgi:hypothetical protein
VAIDVRSSLKRALKSLHSDRARIDRQITAITTALGELGGAAGRVVAKAGKKARRARAMSSAQKKAVSVRMKAYWAKRRAAK